MGCWIENLAWQADGLSGVVSLRWHGRHGAASHGYVSAGARWPQESS